MAAKGEMAEAVGGLVAAAGLAGQDQHTTQERYDSHTQVWVVVLELLALAVCGAGVGSGFALAAGPALELLTTMAALDVALVALGLAGVTWLARLAARVAVMRHDGQPLPLVVARLAATAWGWSAALAGLYLLLVGVDAVNRPAWQGPADRWLLVRLGGGVLMAGVCGLGVYRFAIEIWNPRYPRSPALGVLNRLVELLWDDEEERADEGTLPVPMRVRGHLRGIVSAESGGNGRVHPMVGHLAAFLQEGDRIGFSRRAWLGKAENQPFRLASGLVGRRKEYDQLVELGRRYGLLADLGNGTQWARGVSLEAALQALAAEVEHIVGAG